MSRFEVDLLYSCFEISKSQEVFAWSPYLDKLLLNV